MTEPPYDKLSAVLDAFTDAYGGRTRSRGVTTILLLQQASMGGRGISISEVRRVTMAPLENVRRHFVKQVDAGNLVTLPDPDDERITRYLIANLESQLMVTQQLASRLQAIGRPDGLTDEGIRPFGEETLNALMAVLGAFIDVLGGGLRMRAFRITIAMQQATLMGTGMTPSEIARSAKAPLETVRRAIQQHTNLGNLRLIEDPNDDRATRVLYVDPVEGAETINRIAAQMNQVDWSTFNLD